MLAVFCFVAPMNLSLAFAEEKQPAGKSLRVEDLFIAINQKGWNRAIRIGHGLDAKTSSDPFFENFARAAALIFHGKCDEGQVLAKQVIYVTPDFLPAYDLIGMCLKKEGNAVSASKLYRNIANRSSGKTAQP